MQENTLTRASAQSVVSFIREVDKIFAVIVNESIERELTDEEADLISQREQARKDKDWKLADNLRDKLLEKGVVVEDMAKGTRHFFV